MNLKTGWSGGNWSETSAPHRSGKYAMKGEITLTESRVYDSFKEFDLLGLSMFSSAWPSSICRCVFTTSKGNVTIDANYSVTDIEASIISLMYR